MVHLRICLHVGVGAASILPQRLISGSCMINSSYWISYMALWLKAEKYPVTLVNVYPTFVNLIQALSSWLGTTLAQSVNLKGLWTFQWVS